MKQFRQGDVFLIQVSKLPKGKGKEAATDNGRIVLAYGEVTGHAHAVSGIAAKLLEYGDVKLGAVERFLTVEKTSELRHEEHGAIVLAPGVYKIVRQREYSPERIRNVAD